MKTILTTIVTLVAASVTAWAGCGSCSSCGSCGSKTKGASYTHASASQKADIVTTAAGAGNFTTLVAAVEAAGLVETLKGDGPFTVFAPTDAAFAKLPAGTVENLLKPENKQQLVDILTYHVVPAKVKSSKVTAGAVPTVNGQDALVEIIDGEVFIDGAKVVQTDIMTSNGVIHVIDTIILPKAPGKA